MTWSERTVVRDGVRISCRDRGGVHYPVVLLHGLASHAGEWDTIARRLSSRHRVVAVDQRGHGASERHPHDRSRAAYVADVVAVLEQLDLRQAVLIGQSLGGYTAVLTAAAHPDLVRGLVLVEAGPGQAARMFPLRSADDSMHGRSPSRHKRPRQRSSAVARSARAGRPGWRNVTAHGGRVSTAA
nr:alpha/beta fold hydrolase [Streptomyces sp. MBT33]